MSKIFIANGYTATKTMDIILYLLIINHFFLDRYTNTDPLWSFCLEQIFCCCGN